MNDMRLLTLAEVIIEANKYLDTEPVGDEEFYFHSKRHNIPNVERGGYDDIISFYINSSVAQFKYRDSVKLIEYQLELVPMYSSIGF